MSLDSYYYPNEYTAELSLTCYNCEKDFDKEVDVYNRYYETKCPHCGETTSGEVRG
jgi:DNA-directed RNA polymerase subunit RPC12/RpoP